VALLEGEEERRHKDRCRTRMGRVEAVRAAGSRLAGLVAHHLETEDSLGQTPGHREEGGHSQADTLLSQRASADRAAAEAVAAQAPRLVAWDRAARAAAGAVADQDRILVAWDRAVRVGLGSNEAGNSLEAAAGLGSEDTAAAALEAADSNHLAEECRVDLVVHNQAGAALAQSSLAAPEAPSSLADPGGHSSLALAGLEAQAALEERAGPAALPLLAAWRPIEAAAVE